jgi:hypothetical protein
MVAGLSGLSGLERRCLPPYHQDRMKTSTIIRSNAASLSAARTLSPPSVIATLNPHLFEPNAHGKAGMQVVIDDQDTTHDSPPSRR